jgi:AbrB family looped-hinge helix DNA binding protein
MAQLKQVTKQGEKERGTATCLLSGGEHIRRLLHRPDSRVLTLTIVMQNDIFSLHHITKNIRRMLMKEIISTITSKGQVTIPAEVRKYLGVTATDKIAFVIDDQGTVRLRVPRYPTVASLSGAAGRLKKPLSWQEIQQIAYEDRIKAFKIGSLSREHSNCMALAS